MKCRDCGMILRNAPGVEEVKFRRRRWTAIRQVSDPAHADLMRNYLQVNGYDVAIRNGQVSKSNSRSHGGDGSPIFILVPTESARDAALLLRSDNDCAEDPSSNLPRDHIDIEQEEELIPYEELEDFIDSDHLVGSLGDDDESY
jgi:hypothetical protein